MKINEELLRDAIEYQTRFWKDYGILDISDFNLTTFSASLAGYIQGYCGVDNESEEK